ncbi:MAG: glycine dehydrogenase (aminomethyl-transferring) [Elusimicrobia bacterium GWA2_66_18]|nr:MAG: glycine dehydrogenase (aminomethyl-transferring) [Elusimicrobia bacterium GWA2_66_18]
MEAARACPRACVPAADDFVRRHVGPNGADVAAMLRELRRPSLNSLIDKAVPTAIRLKTELELPASLSEAEALLELKRIASRNQIWRSYLGQGYHDTVTPPVILREVLENAGWYTAYTPYQPEIAQGRLEALLNFQTMIIDLTGLPVANASLLDEGTAAAEAMALCLHACEDPDGRVFFVSSGCHPQTVEVVRTRAKSLGVEVLIGEPSRIVGQRLLGALVQYPDTRGAVKDWSRFAEEVHSAGGLLVVAADPLALTLFKAPGEFDADIAIGSTQRFGVPLGFGGPHAAYLAVKETFQRRMPGRVVGVSKDARGKPALRLSLQTREQHIRREKATSNICTAQVLPAVIAGMYAVYHGPDGLRRIAGRVRALALALMTGLKKLGYQTGAETLFDTVAIPLSAAEVERVRAASRAKRINLRFDGAIVCVALDEAVSEEDLEDLLEIFGGAKARSLTAAGLLAESDAAIPAALQRAAPFLTHRVFSEHRSEHEMLRYLRKLEGKDLSLTHSMIPLGSCTMKLNAASEMIPVTWPEFGKLHPFVPAEQAQGYKELTLQLEKWLAEITGFSAVSLQPNAGSQGEYAGLLVIRAYHESRGRGRRKTCLIPVSAHGTNPASAAMAGLHIVPVACLEHGDIDLSDLKKKASEHEDDLAALMVTYPSTHGVFEEGIRDICAIVHQHGGLVYMDGANMNAQVGLCRPADIGADVCHLNLHKTFCIPHGGGGPGMGPIGVTAALAPFLPGHPAASTGGSTAIGPVSAAPWGSASILPISWMYIRMMGAAGLTAATKNAILNANYIAKRLDSHYPVLFKGRSGLVAHECILDLRGFKAASGVSVDDIAKRLMDYGFHAPTVSWPVSGTVMVEPTESESKAEIDRFCDAMISIREEVRKVERGEWPKDDNPLKHAPHTAESVVSDQWTHPYSRETAAYPAPWLRERKFWPSVGRVDGAFGDRHFLCSCAALS